MSAKPPSATAAELLYESRPIAYTDPAALAATAALFGVQAPGVETARVLEFGCASGGNIIPMAARYPRARFLGLEISPDEVAAGRGRIEALGLANVRLEVADIAQYSAPGDTFDYIIGHGVLSWVPAQVQAAIFRIISESMVERGLAAISFNVLPGWRLQQIIRDICLRHAGEGEPLERADRARTALAQIARGSGDGHPYGALVTDAARRTTSQPLSYILAEFLAEVNECFSFTEFEATAKAAGLHYICEGELAQSIPAFFLPKASQEPVQAFVGANAAMTQQVLDDVSGRTFRRAVMAKQPAHTLDSAALATLHASSTLIARADAPNQVFAPSRQPLTPPDPALAAALYTIAQSSPATTPIGALGAPARDRKQFLDGLLTYIGGGHVRLRTAPLEIGRAGQGAPRAFGPARCDAAAGQPWVTTLDHRICRPPDEVLCLLPLLTGDRSASALASTLAPGDVQEALQFCEREGLLEP